jgi:hypothetical protein
MVATVDLTETMILASLRAVLMGFLPAIEVITAQVNRVPEPIGPDFVVMTPIGRERLATNIANWTDGFFASPQVAGTRKDMQPTKLTVQLDVHGPASANNTQIITTLFRSDVATTAFEALGRDVQALYAEDAHQSPFSNDSDQTESRWTIDVVLQANITVTSPQEFADIVTIGLINVDERFPP